MSLDISSLTGKLNSPVPIRQGQTPPKEHNQKGSNTSKDLEANEESSGFTEIAVLDQISFSKDHKVDYEIDQDTHNVVIRVVDRETGEVVRQTPGEDFLKLTQRIADFNQKYLDEIV